MYITSSGLSTERPCQYSMRRAWQVVNQAMKILGCMALPLRCCCRLPPTFHDWPLSRCGFELRHCREVFKTWRGKWRFPLEICWTASWIFPGSSLTWVWLNCIWQHFRSILWGIPSSRDHVELSRGDPFLGFIISDVLPASSPTSAGQLSASLILRKVLNKVVGDCGKCHISWTFRIS